jgi:hypothetical protein
VAKSKVTKQQLEASKRGKIAAAAKRARDDAYHEALGVPVGVPLPNSLGNTFSAGGGRGRGKAAKNSGKTAAAGGRVKLIS